MDLISKNYKILNSMIPEIVKYSPNSILLVVSNPVDVLTYITYKLSGFPKNRVIGSGTVLDTSRLRYLLSQEFDIDARNIHTYIVGEHGDSEIATWSLTKIGGMDLEDYCKLTCDKCHGEFRKRIHDEVKNAGYEVLKRKGATNFAVALAIKRIVEAILRDENAILTVSTLFTGEYGIEDVYMGIPSIVGRNGVRNVLEVELSDEEKRELNKSSDILKEAFNSLNIK